MRSSVRKPSKWMWLAGGALVIAGILVGLPAVPAILRERLSANPAAASVCNGVAYTVQFLLFLVGVSYLEMNAHNPFIYFNF